MMLSIGTGIVTLANMYFSHEKMKVEFTEMKTTVRNVDSIVTVMHTERKNENISAISEKDSIIKILQLQNQDLINNLIKK